MVKKTLLLIALLLALTALVQAQDISPPQDIDADPNFNIVWPPPVYALHGDIDIYGSAIVENMTNYFLEYRALELDEENNFVDGDDTTPWFPISLPSSSAVSNGVLASWDTGTTEDGLYEIRLTVNISGEQPRFLVVRPLRIQNELPEGVVIDEPPAFATATSSAPLVVTATPRVTRPTLAPSPTALSTTPMITSNVNANVRSGDSTGYPVVGNLLSGQTADVLGISSRGTGWYYIQLPTGGFGWIAPGIVTASGNFASVPRRDPPATPTPAATATFTPVPAVANLGASAPSINPNPPTCNNSFEVLINIQNVGSGQSQPVQVLFQDIHVGSGAVQSQFIRELPALNAGQGYVIGGNFTISTFYSQQHEVRVTIDYNNTLPETNESDNVKSSTYTLQQGGC